MVLSFFENYVMYVQLKCYKIYKLYKIWRYLIMSVVRILFYKLSYDRNKLFYNLIQLWNIIENQKLLIKN